jgi:hypothetical protein
MKCSSTTDVKHSSSGYGAIAQLGERVLCKHEVVGSIPSGSTRWFDHRSAQSFVRENIVPQSLALTRAIDCVISDIVKRRSIRVGSCINSCATLHNLQVISALVHRKMGEL